MKKIFLFCFAIAAFLVSSLINAQYRDTVNVQLDSLKENTVRLDSVWRYHLGDDSTWASPDYSSSNWDTLRTWFDGDETKWIGIGWFRKTIVIDSASRNKSIALSMFHFGASEIYWNGNLAHKFGVVGADTATEENYQPLRIPIILNLDTNLVYTLAIRYSNQKSIIDKRWMNKWFYGNGFKVTLRDVNSSFRTFTMQSRIGSGVNFGISGLYYSLSILYFFLFVFYARRVENLYYSLFTLFLGLVFTLVYVVNSFFFSLIYFVLFQILIIISTLLIFLFYLAFLNSIFYKKTTKIFFLFLLFAIINGLLLFVYAADDIVNILIPVFSVLATLEGLRIIILAIKNKKQNAWIIGGGVISFAALIVVVFAVVFITGKLQINSLFYTALFVLGLFSIPLSMSIYLAKDIALTNKNLEKQLETVKELSAKELEHQKKSAELELKAEREKAENERKTKELEDARELQLSLLPKKIPELSEYEIAVHMETATEVGGDYYDFHVQNNKLTIAIGDATGHGLNAGTMVTATKSLFNNFAEKDDILDSLHKISLSLKKMNFRFLSMCLALLKIEGNVVKISSAGMPPAYIYRKGKAKVDEVLLKGMPLGTVKDFPYKLVETKLESGDVLFLYSDGFPELFNAERELLGYEKIKEEFKKIATDTPQNIIENLKKVIVSWKGNLEINDDITFVVIKKR
ncbi:MAG: SpoIIE family protein phosphatase [Melioribacteraceae bacterium]|nr:SpoIIE family protein phosphatase [Melioribacteraceae bacterium]